MAYLLYQKSQSRLEREKREGSWKDMFDLALEAISKMAFCYDRLRTPRDFVVGGKGSRRSAAKLRAFFACRLALGTLVWSHEEIIFEMVSDRLLKIPSDFGIGLNGWV